MIGGALVLALPIWAYWTMTSHLNDSVNPSVTAEYGVVFGAAVWRNDTPSDALQNRIDAAAQLYKNKQIEKIVLSGGDSTYGEHEVDVMAQELQEMGVPREQMVFDYEGVNTLATLENIKKTLPEATSFIMVSQDFHLGRIGFLSKRVGLHEVHLHAAPYKNGRFPRDTYYRSRELFGLVYYFFSTL